MSGNQENKKNRLQSAAKAARVGESILNFVAGLLIVIMLLYGVYSLWDSAMTNRGAFVSNELLQYKPSDGNLSLEELVEINEDVCAWITVHNTHIDYPVVQGEDNLEYVNKDVKREFALSGAIFLDCNNSPDFSDRYNLLYGHHMANGAMFGDVVNFLDKNVFEQNQTGTVYLQDKIKKFTIFACVKTDAFDMTMFTSIHAGNDNSQLLHEIREKSVHYRDIGLTGNDNIIGLSTCYDAETNGRVIIFGRFED